MPGPIHDFFQRLPEQFNPDAAGDLSAVYQFDLTGSDGGHYHLLISEGRCSVMEGQHAAPQVRFTMSADDCLGVLGGHLDPASLFMAGRLQVAGDLMLALQLKALFPSVG